MSAGVVAGLVAGAVMALFVMAWMATTGRSVWTNPNLIAVMWVGPEAALGGFSGATLLGFATHMATSALMGWIAVPFVRDLPPARTVLVSFAYALASYPLVFALVLTWVNPPTPPRPRSTTSLSCPSAGPDEMGASWRCSRR